MCTQIQKGVGEEIKATRRQTSVTDELNQTKVRNSLKTYLKLKVFSKYELKTKRLFWEWILIRKWKFLKPDFKLITSNNQIEPSGSICKKNAQSKKKKQCQYGSEDR